MKLEAGQVWRRPDGTLWVCDEVAPSGYASMVPDVDDERFPFVCHRHVIEEGWTREVSAEAKRAYADLTGQQEREP